MSSNRMVQKTEDELLVWRYLLGDVAEQEKEMVEERLMADRQYFQQLLRIEEQLTDEYVEGNLSGEEQERFENHFAQAPARRESVEFARVLKRYTSEKSSFSSAGILKDEPDQSEWKHLMAAPRKGWSTAVVASLSCAALLLLAIGILMWIKIDQLGKDNESLRASQSNADLAQEELKHKLEDERARNEKMAEQLNTIQAQLNQKEQELAELRSARQSADNSSVVALVLAPGLDRSEAQANRVDLSRGARRLRLELKTEEGDYRSYRVEVQTVEGKLIWRREGLKEHLKRNRKIIALELSTNILTTGDYLITLSGRAAEKMYEKAATYFFRVIR